jgi:hypothetical protein
MLAAGMPSLRKSRRLGQPVVSAPFFFSIRGHRITQHFVQFELGIWLRTPLLCRLHFMDVYSSFRLCDCPPGESHLRLRG